MGPLVLTELQVQLDLLGLMALTALMAQLVLLA